MCARELGKKERGNGKNKGKKRMSKGAEKEMKGAATRKMYSLFLSSPLCSLVGVPSNFGKAAGIYM